MDLEAQIKCVEREIGMRERVYPSFVARGKMKQEVADRELATMREVAKTLKESYGCPKCGAQRLT